MSPRSTPRKSARPSGSLTADAWIEASLRALSRYGVEAIRVERLAKDLKVTKGSFYWHFEDRPALLDALLSQWRKRATLDVIQRIERANEQPADRLRTLLALPLAGPRSKRGADVEAAIRLWARSDLRAANAIVEIDGMRLRYIESLLKASNHAPMTVAPRALLIYAFILAEASLVAPLDRGISKRCEAMLLAL